MVHEIVVHNVKGNVLFESGVKVPAYSGDLLLLDRSHHHSRKLYVSDPSATTRYVVEDCHYKSRDRDFTDNQRESSSLAGLVAAWPSAFSVDQTLKRTVQGWQEISGFQEEFAVISFSKLLSDSIDKQFASLFRFCRSSSASKERLAFILSLMAFGNPKIVPQLRTLLAFAISPSLRFLPGPEHNSYDLRDGSAVHVQAVKKILEECERLFVPQSDPNRTESQQQAAIREQQKQFDRNMERERQQILAAVTSSWPASTVTLPPQENFRHYSYTAMKCHLDKKFSVWYKNHVFLCQLDAIDEQLRSFHSSWTGLTAHSTILYSRAEVCPPVLSAHRSLLDIISKVKVNEECFNGMQPVGGTRPGQI